MAAESPSACNRQLFEFRVFDDPTILKELANLPAGTIGFSQNFPCVIVVIGHLNNYFDEWDQHLIYFDASLATMGLDYGLEWQGVAGCCINWADIAAREATASRILNLEADEGPIMFIAAGIRIRQALINQ